MTIGSIMDGLNDRLIEIKELGLIDLYGGKCTHHTDKEIPYGLQAIDPLSCAPGEPISNIISANDENTVTAYLHFKTTKSRQVGRHNIPIALYEIVVFVSKQRAGLHVSNYQAALNISNALRSQFKDRKIVIPEGKPKHNAFELAYIEIEELVLAENCNPAPIAANTKCF